MTGEVDLARGAPTVSTVEELLARARTLTTRDRVLVGIAGAPGSGKSTIAELVGERLGAEGVVVPMDGFHLTNDELVRLDRRQRKGAPDTFDVAGYVNLLRRLHAEPADTVYAPRFDRDHEMSIAGEIAVRPEHRIVVTEGNYLLLDSPGWREVRPLLDEAWFVEVDEQLRLERLIRRHVVHGKDEEAAVRWATVSDQANADVVNATRRFADVIVRLE